MIDQEILDIRKEALLFSLTFVSPICEKYPPEAYRITNGPTMPLATPAGSSMMPAEQVVNFCITVADWLLAVD